KLVERYLDRIEAYQPLLNAYIHVNERTLDEAHRMDVERAQRRVRGPLQGIPVLLKDNIDTADMPTTGGALAFAGSIPPAQRRVPREKTPGGWSGHHGKVSVDRAGQLGESQYAG